MPPLRLIPLALQLLDGLLPALVIENFLDSLAHAPILQNYGEISRGWGYRSPVAAASWGATRRSAKSLDTPANRASTGSLVSWRYHGRTGQVATTPRYARKYLILLVVLALVACPGVSHQVVAPVPPVP